MPGVRHNVLLEGIASTARAGSGGSTSSCASGTARAASSRLDAQDVSLASWNRDPSDSEATFPDNFDDPKWLFIPLVQSERCWAFGARPEVMLPVGLPQCPATCYEQLRLQLAVGTAEGRQCGGCSACAKLLALLPLFQFQNLCLVL